MKKLLVFFLIFACSFLFQILHAQNYLVALKYPVKESMLLESQQQNTQVYVLDLAADAKKVKRKIAWGYISSTLTMALSIGSELTREEAVPSIPLGVTATLLFMSSVPIIGAGAKYIDASGMTPEQIHQSKKLAAISWGVYTGATLMATVLIVTGVNDVTAPAGIITLTGIMGTSSILLMTGALKKAAKFTKRSDSLQGKKNINLNFGAAPYKNGALFNLSLRF